MSNPMGRAGRSSSCVPADWLQEALKQPPEIRRVAIASRLPVVEKEISDLETEILIKQMILHNLRLQESDYLIEAAAIDRHWGCEPRNT